MNMFEKEIELEVTATASLILSVIEYQKDKDDRPKQETMSKAITHLANIKTHQRRDMIQRTNTIFWMVFVNVVLTFSTLMWMTW